MNSRSSRLASLLVAAALAAGLAGCTEGTAATEGDSSASSRAAVDIGVGKITPAPSKKIAVMISTTPELSYGAGEAAAATSEAKKLGYEADLYFSNLNPQTELANFQNIANSGKYAGLILHPVNSQLCTPMKTAALQSDLVVEVVNTPLCDDGSGTGAELWSPGTISYIGGQGMRDGVEMVLDGAAKELSGPQKVGLVLGVQGHYSSVAWEVAWKKFAKSHPDWSLAGTVYTDFSTPNAFGMAQNLLTAHPDLTVVFDSYADIATGVVKAVDARGLRGKVAVYENGGGNAAAVAMVKSGELAGDLPGYPSSMLRTATDDLVAVLKGAKPVRYIGGDGNPDAERIGLVTQANVGTFEADY